MISWEPWNTNLADIANGLHDANIISHAQSMRDFGQPIFLRFAHEMNGNWYPWAGTTNGGSTSGAANYIAAWRHVHDIFVAQGAANVVWIWCVNQNDSPAEPWNHWTNYYPGDGYVDWVAVDAYNWGTSNGGWRSMGSLLNTSAYNDYAATKPIMVAETSSNEAGGNKAQWIYDLGGAIRNNFPSVEAVVWFDKSGTSDNWAIDSSAASLDAYRSVGQDSYFGGPGGPDVVVTGVGWSPASLANGNQALFSATIKNQGNASTPDGVVIGVGFFVDGVKTNWYGALNDGGLAPGQSRTITAGGGPSGTRYWTAVSGAHSVRALVDDVNRFPESNEGNNDLSVPITVTSTPAGLSAAYFNNAALSGTALTRTDVNVDFNWGGGAPMSGISTDKFSVRWTGFVTAPFTGVYTFYAKTDDGERLWVNNQLLIDNWTNHGNNLDTAMTTVTLTAGQQYPLKLEYYENTYSAAAQLLWQGPNTTQQVIPASVLSH
jgi:hypothetical protein